MRPCCPPERDFLDASAELAETEQRATQDQIRRERRSTSACASGSERSLPCAVAIVAGALAMTAAGRPTGQRPSRAAGPRCRRPPARRRGAALGGPRTGPCCSPQPRCAWTTRSTPASSLLATLDRAPALAETARSSGHILGLAVDTVADRVAVIAADGVGLELYDGQSLRRLPLSQHLPAGSVFANPGGQGYAMSVMPALVGAGKEPPVLLLDPDGARSAVQLGGIPKGYQVYDNFGFAPSSRWNMGYSPQGRWFTVALRDIQGRKPELMLVWDLHAPAHPAASFELADDKTPWSAGTGTPCTPRAPAGGACR